MNIVKTIFFYYSLLFIFSLLTIGVITKNIFNYPALLFIVIVLTIYFYGYLIVNILKSNIFQNQFFWIGVVILLMINLTLSTLLFASSLIFSKKITDYFISALYFPIPAYFILTIVGWYQKVIQNNKQKIKAEIVSAPVNLRPSSKVDLDRRRFLKILGGTGISIFLMSLLNPKQAGAAFFGSVPGPGTISIKDSNGAKINPAEKQPTDGYKISQIDDANYPYYYGYINSTGAWYIMSEDASSNYRYTKGNSDFATNWTSRASLTYGYFDSIF